MFAITTLTKIATTATTAAIAATTAATTAATDKIYYHAELCPLAYRVSIGRRGS